MGLSTGYTGLYTSDRHAQAREDGKLTAGEASKVLSKNLGTKISAKELVEAHKLLFGQEPEWHHSGFYKPQGQGRKTMGRTFFFDDVTLTIIEKRWSEVEPLRVDKEKKEEEKKQTIARGFYWVWNHDYSGKYGKRRNFKKLYVYEGSEADAPHNFTRCNNQQFEKAKAAEGKSYYGWDEPSVSEFE